MSTGKNIYEKQPWKQGHWRRRNKRHWRCGSRDSNVACEKDSGGEDISLQPVKDFMAEQGIKWEGRHGRHELLWTDCNTPLPIPYFTARALESNKE